MKAKEQPKRQVTIGREQKIDLITTLRDARATVQKDAESFDQAASMLEHIGQVLAGEVRNGLGAYQKEICQLATTGPETNTKRVEQLFNTVRTARNDAVHGGSYIRHHANHLVELLLILEEALMQTVREVRDLMVQNPVTAELWQNIATIRRTMLANAFSYLPVKDLQNEWRLISVFGLVKYMEASEASRNGKLGKSLEEALTRKEITLEVCNIRPPTEEIANVYSIVEEKPMLVVEATGVGSREESRLVGILTAFDLL